MGDRYDADESNFGSQEHSDPSCPGHDCNDNDDGSQEGTNGDEK